jgi:hypothetical protein
LPQSLHIAEHHRQSRRQSKVTNDTEHKPEKERHLALALKGAATESHYQEQEKITGYRPSAEDTPHAAHLAQDHGTSLESAVEETQVHSPHHRYHQKLSLLLQQKRLPPPSQAPSQAVETTDTRGLLYKSSIDPKNQI